MLNVRSHLLLRLLSVSVLLLLPLFQALGQEDADPNSPTPVILSQADSTRALTSLSVKPTRLRLGVQAFRPDSTVTIYVTNLDLMKGEGATAFRLYGEDAKGHQFRFPILDLYETPGFGGIYTVTFRLTDEVGYWEPPTADGDLLMGITWRGLASNRVRLGLGKTGGAIKDDPGAVPTPLSAVKTLNTKSTGEPPTSDYVGYRYSGDRIRFLEQATFGPTQALDSRIRRIGLRTWLAEQFEIPYPSSTNPYPDLQLKNSDSTVPPPSGCGAQNTPDPTTYAICIRDFYSMYPIQTWFYREALYGEPQLRHRVNWALDELWVISGANGDTQQASHMIAYHQAINRNVFGNWRSLMYDVTLNPGMGNYLDMIRSTRTNPNENYPREVLQLFNIGLFMLNQDGTMQLDGQGNPIPTYDQNVINNFTRVFTGWRDCRASGPTAACPNITLGAVDYKDPMELITGNHDLTAKTLLTYPGSTTTNIAACTGCTAAQITTYANNSLNQALDNIYNHPNVAPFVSKYLIQQLVTSDPTPAYVGRVSAVFNANRTSPTQLKEVVTAILLDPEARGDVKTDSRYGKLREPVQLMTNLFRQVGVTSADGLSQSDGDVNRFPNGLSQGAFTSPTVFNFYPPSYIVPGTTLLGPEFAIFTTGTSIGRANFGNSTVFGQINVSLPNTPNGTRVNFTELQALAAADTTSNQLLDVLDQRMMHGTMSAQMRSTVMTGTNAVASTDPLGRARAAVYLVVTSSQYQVQR